MKLLTLFNLNNMYINDIYHKINDLSIIERQALTALEEGSIRTIEFWENAIISGFCSRDYLLKSLSLMFPVLDKMFPNNWEVYWYNIHGGILPKIVIYFPEVTIVNSQRQNTSHLIKGLGVVLKFSIDNDIPYIDFEIKGFRTTISYLEWKSGYKHSHLHIFSSSYENFMEDTKFCLGSSEILDVLADLKKTNPLENSEMYSTIFEALCFMIVSLTQTESEEGVPYIRYRTITGNSNNTVNLSDIVNSFTNLLNFIKSENIKLGFDYVWNGFSYLIKPNQKFRERIKKLLLEMNETTVFVSVDENGNEYQYVPRDVIGNNIVNFLTRFYLNDEIPFITIQGRRIEMEIEPPIRENNVENYQVSSRFLKYAKQEFEKEINKKIIENTVTRAYNKIILKKANNGENSVFV